MPATPSRSPSPTGRTWWRKSFCPPGAPLTTRSRAEIGRRRGPHDLVWSRYERGTGSLRQFPAQWYARCKAQPEHAALTISRMARLAVELAVGLLASCAAEPPPKSPSPKPLLYASQGGAFATVDPHVFRVTVYNRKGRLVAEHGLKGFRFTAGGREFRLGPLVSVNRGPDPFRTGTRHPFELRPRSSLARMLVIASTAALVPA